MSQSRGPAGRRESRARWAGLVAHCDHSSRAKVKAAPKGWGLRGLSGRDRGARGCAASACRTWLRWERTLAGRSISSTSAFRDSPEVPLVEASAPPHEIPWLPSPRGAEPQTESARGVGLPTGADSTAAHSAGGSTSRATGSTVLFRWGDAGTHDPRPTPSAAERRRRGCWWIQPRAHPTPLRVPTC